MERKIMNGRLENQIKNEVATEKRLENMPDFVKRSEADCHPILQACPWMGFRISCMRD